LGAQNRILNYLIFNLLTFMRVIILPENHYGFPKFKKLNLLKIVFGYDVIWVEKHNPIATSNNNDCFLISILNNTTIVLMI
jgi:hypothetical protein